MVEQDQRRGGSGAAELHATLEADTSTIETSYERANALRRIAELYRVEGDEEAARIVGTQAALFDFMALPRGERRNGTDARFFPKIEYTDGSASPTMAAFGDAAVAAIEAWLASTTNPIHRARCADFLWEKRRDYRTAQVAVDAYLEAADLYLANRWYPELADAIDRASELALKLKDRARRDRAKAAGFRIADELVHNKRHDVLVYTRDILGTLQGFGRWLTDEEWARIVALVEECIAIFDHDGTGKRGFLELLWSPEARRRQPDQVAAAKRRFAESLEAEAREAMTTKGALVGLVTYRRALDAYIEVGDTTKIDELKRLVGEAADASECEMKPVSATVTIPREQFERRTNWLLTHDLHDALMMLALYAWPIPKVDEVREHAAENRRRFPIQWLATRVTLKDGRVVDAPSTEEEIEQSSFAHEYEQERGFRRMELSLIMDRLEDEKGLDTATLVNLLRRGGLVDKDTLETISVGFDRYFAGDYVSALHILVPQLEDVLRGFLVPLGVATTSVREGLTREKPLDEVLRTPKLRAVLGEDLAVFLEMLFTDQRGANMRNEAAHGLIKAKDCTRDRLHYVIFCYITLARYTVSERVVSADERSAQNAVDHDELTQSMDEHSSWGCEDTGEHPDDKPVDDGLIG